MRYEKLQTITLSLCCYSMGGFAFMCGCIFFGYSLPWIWYAYGFVAVSILAPIYVYRTIAQLLLLAAFYTLGIIAMAIFSVILYAFKEKIKEQEEFFFDLVYEYWDVDQRADKKTLDVT